MQDEADRVGNLCLISSLPIYLAIYPACSVYKYLQIAAIGYPSVYFDEMVALMGLKPRKRYQLIWSRNAESKESKSYIFRV